MNTIIFQTIRSFAILGVIFFAFTGEVFAAPTLLPTSSLEISSTGATIRAYVQNPGESSVVWFEWSEASSVAAPTVVAMSNFFGDGFFAARLDGLTPGIIYSYRAVVKSGGATVYSPTASFRTLGGSSATATTASSQGPLGLGPISDTTATPVVTQPVVSQTSKSATKTVIVKKSTDTTSLSDTTSGAVNKSNTNNNMASVIGAGNGVLPDTLVGWVALIIATLVAVLLVVMISESSERRKKVRVMKKINGEEVLIEE